MGNFDDKTGGRKDPFLAPAFSNHPHLGSSVKIATYGPALTPNIGSISIVGRLRLAEMSANANVFVHLRIHVYFE